MGDEFFYSENDLSVEEYKLLRADAGWKNLPDDQIEQSLNSCDYVVSVRKGGQIAAMARCLSDGIYMAYIFDVVVYSEYRGRNIGKAMIEKVINHYKSGSNYLMQLVLLAVTSDVEPFYKKLGFKKYPNLLNGSGMGMWINGKPY